jgi:hypothetical protein
MRRDFQQIDILDKLQYISFIIKGVTANMKNRAELSFLKLMNLQTEAGFTYDGDFRLLTINEPWDGTVPAPRFFLGRTIDGQTVRRYRHDLSASLVDRLELLSAGEIPAGAFEEKPKHFDEYLAILGAETFAMGPCFSIPPQAAPSMLVVRITRDNIGNYSCEGFEWLVSEIDVVQPCVALIHDGRIVSQCRSVRISPQVHEAGLETLESFRGRGYASAVTAGWALAVRETGALPLYSTSWKNTASQKVARKMGLRYYGGTFSIS